MAKFGGTELTNGGRKLLAKALVGKPIKFTRAWGGEGFLPEGQNIGEMTALVAPIREMGITEMDVPPLIGTATISVVLTNKDNPRGFFLREIGLYAEDPDTGEEILYGYCNAGEFPDYVPGYGGADAVYYQVDFTAVVDQASDVTAVFVENPLGATKADLNKGLDKVRTELREALAEKQRQIDCLAEAVIRLTLNHVGAVHWIGESA